MKEEQKILIIEASPGIDLNFPKDIISRFPSADFDTISEAMTRLKRIRGKGYHQIFLAISPDDLSLSLLWAIYGSAFKDLLTEDAGGPNPKQPFQAKKGGEVPLTGNNQPPIWPNMLHKIKEGRRIYFIKEEDISYIKSDSYYCDYVLENRRITVRQSLAHLENIFVNFKRVHRSFLVNPTHIDYVERLKTRALCKMNNGDQLPISNLEALI